MIIGIGTDIVQIKRITRLFAKYGELFKNRILESREITKFNTLAKAQQVNFLAKRFAAKEAISKALGTGISAKLAFKNIAILNNERGKPFVEIVGTKVNTFNFIKYLQINLSIADDYPVAIAFSVISLKVKPLVLDPLLNLD